MKVIIEFNPNVAGDIRTLAALAGVLPVPQPAKTRAEATSDAEADTAEERPTTMHPALGSGYGLGGGVVSAVDTYPSFTAEDVVEATLSLANAKGVPAAAALLKEFGVEKARDVPTEKRAEYITAAAKAKNAQA